MPAVGDLDRIGQRSCCRFPVATTPVPRDHANAGMGGKPRGGGRDLVVGQKLDDAAPFQIADDRAVAMAAAERLGSGLIDQSQKMTVAAMQMAEKKVWAHRS